MHMLLKPSLLQLENRGLFTRHNVNVQYNVNLQYNTQSLQ